MPEPNEHLSETIPRIGGNDDVELLPAAVAKLVAMGLVELADGKPRLTDRGQEAYTVLESGDGEVPCLE